MREFGISSLCGYLMFQLKVQFFAHLTVAEVISVESFSALLHSFIAVLDEFGVSHARAKKAALCASEGLMIVRYLISSVNQSK